MLANVWFNRALGAVSLGSAVAVSLWAIACGSGGGTPAGDAGNQDVQILHSDSGETELPVPFESGAGNDSGTGGNCLTPSSVAGLVPSGRGIPTGLCSPTQIENIVNDCFGGDPDASASACSDLQSGSTAYANCFGCISTSWSRDKWGALVIANNQEFLNTGGCFVAADPSNTKCATDLQEQLECEIYACQANCPVPALTAGADPTAIAAFDDATMLFGECQGTADNSGCAKYVAAVNTDCPLDAGTGALNNCLNDITALESTTTTAVQLAAATQDYFNTICAGGMSLHSDGGTTDAGPPPADASDGG
jgi:hypothetical protein